MDASTLHRLSFILLIRNLFTGLLFSTHQLAGDLNLEREDHLYIQIKYRKICIEFNCLNG